MISFAFKTQIYNKVIWKQIQKLLAKNMNSDLFASDGNQVALMT